MVKIIKTPLKRIGELKYMNFIDEVIRFSRVCRLASGEKVLKSTYPREYTYAHTTVEAAFKYSQRTIFRRQLRMLPYLLHLLQIEESENRSGTTIKEFLDKPLSFITTTKYVNLLAKGGITTIRQCIDSSEEQIRSIKGMCNQGFDDVKEGLALYGFYFGGVKVGGGERRPLDGNEHWRFYDGYYMDDRDLLEMYKKRGLL